jgi:hypothetical protein
VEGPDDSFVRPDWLLNELQKIASTTVPVPDNSTIRFEVSAKAAKYNADLLKVLNYSIPDLLKSQRGSKVSFGSKFRPVDQLCGLLYEHPVLAVCAIRLNGQTDRVIRPVRITIRTRTVAIPQ